jgi:RNA polymerase-binding transcription factor DksA
MKTYLNEEKLAYYRDKLLELKSETESQMERTKDNPPNEEVQELADYGNHPADIGTEQFEQERDAGMNLVYSERLAEIEAALERIDNKTYGLSEVSQKPIPEERLEVMPTARTLVEEESNRE